jgi:hypothetical protein
MISSPTPEILEQLKVVLGNLMAEGQTKTKFISALDDAIHELINDEVSLITGHFAVNITATDNGGVIIDIFSKDGPLIDTIEYDSADILTNDEYLGEA